jgi:ELWxxDGT repeat protein
MHVSGQHFSLFKDINGSNPGSNAYDMTQGPNGFTYFTAEENGYGTRYLYKTDGTEAGTVKVSNVLARQGIMGSAGSWFYFQSNNTLFKTDGTEANTVQVKTTGDIPQNPYSFKDMGGVLYFVASTPATGVELWRSDGTDAGTVMVKDINPGTAPANPNLNEMIAVGGQLYFAATTAANGRELWKTDGTAAGTMLVRDINSGTASAEPLRLVNYGGLVYFTAITSTNGEELWKSNGTTAGTVMVRDLVTGTGSSGIQFLQVLGTELFFCASLPTAGLWKTNGTSPGTVLVKAGPTISYGNVKSTGSLIIFDAYVAGAGLEIWRSDGTAAGTYQLKDIYAGTESSYPEQLTLLNNIVYFVARQESFSDKELWRTDGTVAGTYMVKNIHPQQGAGTYIYNLVASHGKLYFAADDPYHDREPWMSDGTEAGTVIVKNLVTKTLHGVNTPLYSTGTSTWFAADDGSNGTELWKTNGTAAGTEMVKDIANLSGYYNWSKPEAFTQVGSTIYFIAEHGDNYKKLYKTDGTAAGTQLVKDIYPYNNAGITNLTNMNGLLYFKATNTTYGNELWRSDGTDAGTYVVKDIYPGSNSGVYAGEMVVLNNILYFTANAGTGAGMELWRSDGTNAGTYMLKDIYPGASSGYPQYFIVFNNHIYFRATDNLNGSELWTSDGTVAGTVMVKNIWPGNGSSNIQPMYAAEDYFYFVAADGTTGLELWKSDGTTAGTVQVKDLTPGASGTSFSTEKFVTAGNDLYFIANNGSGLELWKSNGTDAGTFLLKDINPGSAASNPKNLSHISGMVFFTAFEPSTGEEVYRTNGTPAGTILLQDINPGSASSSPGAALAVGNKMLVYANTPDYGFELMQADLSMILPLTLLQFSAQLQQNDGILTWKTDNEQNTSHFEIERSTDGRNFVKAGTAGAAGNTSFTRYYSFTDRSINLLGASVIYYRLKSIDLDGKFTFSGIRTLTINNKPSAIRLYPNPAGETLALVITSEIKGKAGYFVTDPAGRIIFTGTAQLNEGRNIIDLPVARLGAGTYYVTIEQAGTRTHSSFIKL